MAERLIGLPPNSENALQNRGKNYLLVIGIDKYKDSNVPKLQNAVLDTERLTKILTTKYEFELFRALHNEKATKDAIEDTIRELEGRLTTDDNLIIFFSGHGYRKNVSGFIVPFDGQNDRTNRYISFVELNRQINDLSMNHFLFILDCCYAGSALKNLGEKRQLNKPSRRILAASSPEETAQDGFHGRNSPFTAALAEILEQNEGKELPVKTLHVELRELMDSRGIHQVPVEGSWKMDSNCDGEFVFLKKDAEIDTWNALNKSDKNALVAFTNTYPNSDFFADATVFIQEIEAKDAAKRQEAEANQKIEVEKRAYKAAIVADDIKIYTKFITEFPKSAYKSEIKDLLKDKRAVVAWEKIKDTNHIEKLDDFIDDYEDHPLADIARQRMTDLSNKITIETPKLPVIEELLASSTDFFMSLPSDDFFNADFQMDFFMPGVTYYQFKVESNGTNAKFWFIEDEPLAVYYALSKPQTHIMPACLPINAYDTNAKKIITIQLGRAHLEGYKWIIDEKSKIRYE